MEVLLLLYSFIYVASLFCLIVIYADKEITPSVVALIILITPVVNTLLCLYTLPHRELFKFIKEFRIKY